MNKLLLLFAIGFFPLNSFGQDPDLLGNWQLINLNIDQQDYTPTSNDEVEAVILDLYASTYDTNVCDSREGNILYDPNNTEFTVVTAETTLGGCFYGYDLNFQLKYFSFFNSGPDPYLYTITNEGNGIKLLFVTDIEDNVATYRNELIQEYVFNEYYLQYMIINGEDIFVPVNGESFIPTIEFQSTNDPAVATYSGNSGCTLFNGTLTYNGINHELTLVDNSIGTDECTNQSNIDYEALYREFLFVNQPETFRYAFFIVDGEIIFYLRDIDDNYAIYSNPLLSTNDFNKVTYTVYPNPVSNDLFISSEITIESISVFSISGKKVMEQANPNNSIDVSALPQGMYFLELTSENGKAVQKFIKQ
jgi:Secretion system C-terminal sorting domain